MNCVYLDASCDAIANQNSNLMNAYFKNLRIILIEKISIPIVIIWLLMSISSISLYHFYPIFILNENQILYIFSSASQVIAAIYGLIITGYIFLRNELDRKADKDETYEEIISLLKTEYFYSIISISITAFASILLCFLVLADETHESLAIVNYLINITIVTIIITLLIIFSFVIKILNPNSLESASDKLKEITTKDKENDKGSLEVFLQTYNTIEYILDKYGTDLMFNNIDSIQTARSKRVAKTKLADVLYKGEKIDLQLRNNLIELISFRNSLIHGSDLTLSTKDVELAQKILNNLKASLAFK